MDVRTGSQHLDSRAGFTLVELLLAVGLVLLLLSAVVFNFSNLQRGASLDEGANQLEALIRFARAHASSNGRQVQITFEEDVGDGLLVPLGNLRVLWEPDPVARPGHFEPVTELQEYVTRITDLVSIEGVRLVQGDSFEPELASTSTAPDESAEGNSVIATFPPIGFFPDGSSDSAEIIVASRSDADTRRIAVRLQGITGSIRRQIITDELRSGAPESPVQAADTVTRANATSLP
jgi:type II secretory pathway pseudopilin PulG